MDRRFPLFGNLFADYSAKSYEDKNTYLTNSSILPNAFQVLTILFGDMIYLRPLTEHYARTTEYTADLNNNNGRGQPLIEMKQVAAVFVSVCNLSVGIRGGNTAHHDD